MKISILVVLAIVATPAFAADELLSSLAGKWVGRGLFCRNAEAKPEQVYCKIANALTPEGNALILKGRCALAGNSSAALEIKITALGAGSYAGSGGGLGVAARGQATLTGTGTDNQLDLVAQLVNTQTQKMATATAEVDVSPDGSFGMQAQVTDPETGATYTASEIIFRPPPGLAESRDRALACGGARKTGAGLDGNRTASVPSDHAELLLQAR